MRLPRALNPNENPAQFGIFFSANRLILFPTIENATRGVESSQFPGQPIDSAFAPPWPYSSDFELHTCGFSIFINNGGRNRKSATRAKVSTRAVMAPMLLLR
ncbi:MAG: hypothetical protein BECKG1743D_GA0114223_100406 [Candidatus Kentron sp. G]|nr:MAG: hypothetical protein BECKG1743F_GA0114225_100495 [Candidatus Kentron sp. G]VFM96032.1 MAG: hypothetical protein BECKG1743E_GA0114224_100324 [Candidatus Kentron sp. G]VFM97986.1 MAG: hypothetical protein BECKG1743D_GA0114223_100406 [Candidatus Kentron sp. G]